MELISIYVIFALFMLCVYYTCLWLYKLYICVHQHAGLDFHILGSKKKMFIPYHLIMGLRMGLGYEVQDRRLPKDSRGPQQHAPLPCRRRGVSKREGWGLAVVQDVLVSLVSGWCFQTSFYFHSEPRGNDPI